MGHVYQSTQPLSRFKEHHSRGGGKNLRAEDREECWEKLSSLCGVTVVVTTSQQLWLPTQDQVSQHSLIDRVMCSPIPTLLQAPLAVDSYWGQRDSFSLEGVATGRSPTFQWMTPTPTLHMSRTNNPQCPVTLLHLPPYPP